jgi:hypothetical protein
MPGVNLVTPALTESVALTVARYRFAQATHSGVSNIDNDSVIDQLRKNTVSDAAANSKKVIENFKGDQGLVRSQNWHSSMQIVLQNPSTWDDLPEHLHHLGALVDDYSAFTSEALAKMSGDLLPSIETSVREALQEVNANADFHRNNLLIDDYQKYKTYLTEYLAVIHREKQLLALTLFNRLRLAAARQDIAQDDVIYSVIENIVRETTGVRSLGLSLSGERRTDLTPALFKQFQHFIHHNGTKEQRRVLQNTGWPHPKSPYVTIIRGGQCLLVPQAMAKLIPAQRGFFNRASYDAAFIAQSAIKNSQKPLTPLQLRPDLSDCTQLAELIEQEKQLQDAISALENKKYTGFFLRLFARGNAQLENWQQFLQARRTDVLKQHVKVLQHYTNKTLEWQDSGLIAVNAEAPTLKAAVKNHVEDLLKRVSHPDVRKSLNTQLGQLDAENPLIKTCFNYLNQLAEGKAPTGGKMDVLYRYHAYLKDNAGTDIKPLWYDALCEKAVNQALNRLSVQFSSHHTEAEKYARRDIPAQNSRIKTIAASAFRNIVAIQQLGSDEQKRQLTATFEGYLHDFLASIAKGNTHDRVLDIKEVFLLTLSQKEGYLENGFIHRMVEIFQNSRLKGDKEGLQRKAAHALQKLISPARAQPDTGSPQSDDEASDSRPRSNVH